MARITFITGGQRSGKSLYAMKRAESLADNPLFLATARVWDEDFKQRIERHRADRGPAWETLEEDKHIGRLKFGGRTVVLDCITLWLNNFFHDSEYDVDKALKEAVIEWEEFIRVDFELFVISNEVGMGIHAENEAARKFADLQGWMNQRIAAVADEVIFMVAGIPQRIK